MSLGNWGTDRFSDIRDVDASIAFASEVHLPVFHAKKPDEVLPEPDELDRELIFGLDVWFALCVANAEWLIDPDDIRQVEPCEWIWHRCIHARKPIDGPILGEQTLH